VHTALPGALIWWFHDMAGKPRAFRPSPFRRSPVFATVLRNVLASNDASLPRADNPFRGQTVVVEGARESHLVKALPPLHIRRASGWDREFSRKRGCAMHFIYSPLTAKRNMQAQPVEIAADEEYGDAEARGVAKLRLEFCTSSLANKSRGH